MAAMRNVIAGLALSAVSASAAIDMATMDVASAQAVQTTCSVEQMTRVYNSCVASCPSEVVSCHDVNAIKALLDCAVQADNCGMPAGAYSGSKVVFDMQRARVAALCAHAPTFTGEAATLMFATQDEVDQCATADVPSAPVAPVDNCEEASVPVIKSSPAPKGGDDICEEEPMHPVVVKSTVVPKGSNDSDDNCEEELVHPVVVKSTVVPKGGDEEHCEDDQIVPSVVKKGDDDSCEEELMHPVAVKSTLAPKGDDDNCADEEVIKVTRTSVPQKDGDDDDNCEDVLPRMAPVATLLPGGSNDDNCEEEVIVKATTTVAPSPKPHGWFPQFFQHVPSAAWYNFWTKTHQAQTTTTAAPVVNVDEPECEDESAPAKHNVTVGGSDDECEDDVAHPADAEECETTTAAPVAPIKTVRPGRFGVPAYSDVNVPSLTVAPALPSVDGEDCDTTTAAPVKKTVRPGVHFGVPAYGDDSQEDSQEDRRKPKVETTAVPSISNVYAGMPSVIAVDTTVAPLVVPGFVSRNVKVAAYEREHVVVVESTRAPAADVVSVKESVYGAHGKSVPVIVVGAANGAANGTQSDNGVYKATLKPHKSSAAASAAVNMAAVASAVAFTVMFAL